MKKYLFVLTLVLIGSIMQAQKLPILNQHYINRFSLSPSYAGLEDGVSLFAGYRNQWADIEGAPITKVLSVNSPIGKNIGLGATLMNDQEGYFNRLYGSLSYAYHLTLDGEHNISFGLTGMFFEHSINLTDANVGDINDPVIQGKYVLNETVFNAGASVLYRWQGLNVGFNAPLIIQNRSKYNRTNDIDDYLLKRHYLVHAIYDYQINDIIDVSPYVILRMNEYAPMSYEFAALARYKKFVWAGASYRREGSIGANVGFMLSNTMMFHYTYEFGGKNMTGNTNGSHEFSLGIYIGRGIKKIKEQQDEINKRTDSLVSETDVINENIEKAQEENKVEREKMVEQIEQLQQRLNEAELELGNMKRYTDEQKLEEEKKKAEIDEEIKDIEDKINEIGGDFYVIIESFKIPENAKKAIDLWNQRGIETNMIYNEVRDWYYIYVGKYPTFEDALKVKKYYRDQNIEAWIFLWVEPK
jgi:type IX secretion system PorP/SprF family membrane protein